MLNFNPNYVKANFMIDGDETTLSDKSSFFINKLGGNEKSGLYQFVPNELVYHYVARLMKGEEEFKDSIESVEKDVDAAKKEAKDVVEIMMNYMDKNQK